MGQKVNPLGFRIGIYENWRSRWYANKADFGKYLVEDFKIRTFVKENYSYAMIQRTEVERTNEKVTVILYSARPGLLIGKKGSKIERMKEEIAQFSTLQIDIKIEEIARPDICSLLVAEQIAEQLEKRASFRRTMKKAMETVIAQGGLGIKIQLSGRLGGAEMARTEHCHSGSIPLQTLRADIDYGFTEAKTIYGQIGVKVWIYKGLKDVEFEPSIKEKK
jgi:small subunit ribosomal protein S3